MTSAVSVKADGASWQKAHEALVVLATERAGLDFEEGRWLLRAYRAGVHERFGYASFHEYTERLFGYALRLSQEKLRVAEALEELPETSRELRNGGINFSLARELTRVATPTTEKEWLEAARGRTVREVEQLVSGHRRGSLPDDVPEARLKRHVIRLELSGDVLATFREAMAKIRRDAGEPLDDDGAILLLCRQALEGKRDSGRSSYQIALTVCERCRSARQQGRGELVDVGPEIVEMAECDGQHIGNASAGAWDGETSGAHVGAYDDADVALRVRGRDDAGTSARVGGDNEKEDDAGRSRPSQGRESASAHVGALGRAHDESAVNAAGVLAGANTRAHVGALERKHDDSAVSASLGALEREHDGAAVNAAGVLVGANSRALVRATLVRATQTVPPATRRAVLRRDQGKCRVPGCRHAVFTEPHHIDLRSEYGTNDGENLITLCAAHHRAVHLGRLIITGTASSARFAHADGTAYGGSADPAAVAAREKAFQALRGLGFREGDAKRALARIPSSVFALEAVVRQALRELAPLQH